jgi:hypothetical protein
MQDLNVNVVVVFQSRIGSTEQLALAAAVGAVQGRANIRLRRLPDNAEDAMIEAVPEWEENRRRMNMEYVEPREADAGWADAIVAGIPAGADSLSTEFERYFDSLDGSGKLGALFTHGFGADSLYAAMRRAGLTVVPEATDPDTLTAARLQGLRVAEAVRSLKAARRK